MYHIYLIFTKKLWNTAQIELIPKPWQSDDTTYQKSALFHVRFEQQLIFIFSSGLKKKKLKNKFQIKTDSTGPNRTQSGSVSLPSLFVII